MEEEGGDIVVLEKEHEYRFEVAFDSDVSITLVSGTAELFGVELPESAITVGKGCKGAIFTWHGCKLEVRGQRAVSYIANETPMVSYLMVHATLEDRRQAALEWKQGPVARTGVVPQGPRVIICGPTDVGKSTVSRLLLNYAVRRGHRPLFVDLDIGQGSITIPAAIAALPVDDTVSFSSDSVSTAPPLVYYYGHVTPGENKMLFEHMVERMAATLEMRMSGDDGMRAAGMVINTCGWVDGVGYELLLHSIQTLRATVVLVIDHERLYNDLNAFSKDKGIEVVKLAKSGGVVTRDTAFRRKTRSLRIREYFYGTPENGLSPFSRVVHYSEVNVYRVGAPQVPSTALPIGAAPTLSPMQLMEVAPDVGLTHAVLAVSHAMVEQDILDANVAGFVYVTEVNVVEKKLTLLTPAPGPLPGRFLVMGSLKWYEA